MDKCSKCVGSFGANPIKCQSVHISNLERITPYSVCSPIFGFQENDLTACGLWAQDLTPVYYF
jgi:hypothetical protein